MQCTKLCACLANRFTLLIQLEWRSECIKLKCKYVSAHKHFVKRVRDKYYFTTPSLSPPRPFSPPLSLKLGASQCLTQLGFRLKLRVCQCLTQLGFRDFFGGIMLGLLSVNYLLITCLFCLLHSVCFIFWWFVYFFFSFVCVFEFYMCVVRVFCILSVCVCLVLAVYSCVFY